jgi:hypothetical protein
MKAVRFIIYLCCSLSLLTGCKKILDVENVAAFDPEKVWSDPQLASAYLTNLYAAIMPAGWPVNSGGNADELAGNLGAGAVTSANGAFQYWPYASIRNINILFNEIDHGSLTDAVKAPIKGQAYFLRAWAYFNMVVNYGGVPIIDKPQGVGDDLFVTRNTTEECFDFIESDLQKALSVLPDKYIGDDRGRADRATVLAFLGRVLLFKASPQFHSTQPYDNADWAKAYTANKEAKETLSALGYNLVPSYAAIWDIANKGNSEAILSLVFKKPNKTNGRQEDAARPLSESKNATGGDQPIWEMVQSFPMKDGYQPGSSPAYNYDVQTYWENRDPRFYANVVYNGSVYELSNKTGRRQYTTSGIATNEDMFGPGQLFNRTGFFPRKGMDPSLLQAEVGDNETDWIELRYAEVLLNFAEAANETGHPEEAMQVLVQIRQRAGLDPGAASLYGLAAGMSRDQIRDAIYLERKLEFMYEGKRFLDLRRARKLNLVDGMSKHGLQAILKSGKNPSDGSAYLLLPEDFTYTVLPLLSNGTNVMSTPGTYYFFPISQSEMEKNPNLLQTAGWDGGTFNPTLD